MNGGAPMPPGRVPTLTEVVSWPEHAQDLSTTGGAYVAAAQPASPPDLMQHAQHAPEMAAITETQITQQVLADVQRQIDLMLEYRLREALAPVLARAADSLVRDARNEMASTLRDVVARAVAQELSRHRNR